MTITKPEIQQWIEKRVDEEYPSHTYDNIDRRIFTNGAEVVTPLLEKALAALENIGEGCGYSEGEEPGEVMSARRAIQEIKEEMRK